MSTTSPEILVKLIASGNREAFDEFFRMYYPKLRAYAVQILKDSSEAEDIVQEVFFNIWVRREMLDQIKSPDAYLRVSVFNRSISFLKGKQRNPVDESLNSYLDNEDLYIDILHHQTFSTGGKELAELITRKVEELPEQCKKVFKLSRSFGLKNAEIAETLGISIKSVEKHMTKALHFFRVELAEYLPLLPLWFFFDKN